jgi:UDP-2,3-diacylglucosamine pyrophosphatase LpxH
LRTALVSDLHLGSVSERDLLRTPAARETFLEVVADADEVVLLGDVLELFELPLALALGRARPFLEALGETMAGRRIVVVPGNHDHRLAEPLLESHALEERPLALEQRECPLGEAAEQIAAWLDPAELEIAYPGLWLRKDIYATHGHYMDCHRRLPRLECIAAAATTRAFGQLPAKAGPDDYERVLWPVYGLAFGLAQVQASGRIIRPSERMWRAVSGDHGPRKRIRRGLLRAALPAAIAGVNAALGADFASDFSPGFISSTGVTAAAELARRLDVGAEYMITGHTHRVGPLADDRDWALTGGATLVNTGSWISTPAFQRNPSLDRFRPGTVTWVEDDGPPLQIFALGTEIIPGQG